MSNSPQDSESTGVIVTASPLARSEEVAWLLGLLLSCALFTLFLYDRHGSLVPGDHGRDLHAYELGRLGRTPYRDYQWKYGPLMPYVFGGAWRVTGRGLDTLRAAYLALLTASALVLYFVARRLLPAPLAFLASIASFAHGQPFHTFNHVGGTLAGSVATLFLLRWLEDPRRPRRRLALACACAAQVVFALVKLNMAGAVSLAHCFFLLRVGWRERDREANPAAALAQALRAPVAYGLSWLVATLCAYLPFVAGVSRSHLLQCFPWGTRQLVEHGSPWDIAFRFPEELWAHAFGTSLLPWDLVFSRDCLCPFLLVLGVSGGLVLSARYVLGSANAAGAAFLLLTLQAAFAAHEFLQLSTHYSLFYFVAPSVNPLVLALGHKLVARCRELRRGGGDAKTGAGRLAAANRAATSVLCAALGAGLLVAHAVRVPVDAERWLDGPGIRAYCGPTDTLAVIEEVARRVRGATRPDEPIVAFPFDPLYYYLTGRENGIYPEEVFEESDLSLEDEEECIRAMEARGVRCVLLSNAALWEDQRGLGAFGKTYAFRLAAYLDERYRLVWPPPPAYFPRPPNEVSLHRVLIWWRQDEEVPAALK
ncbi:MAG: hypothetical protein HYZ53_04945 [Planctomycetes bacterium]|nr:hypothetical protein [Planctomycetota bacterium]